MKKQTSIFLFSISLMFFSCDNNTNNSSILNEEIMTEVLAEVMLLENYYQSKYGSIGVYKSALDSSVQEVFKLKGTNKKQFEKSFDYYSNNPDKFKAIQEKIIEQLNKKHL